MEKNQNKKPILSPSQKALLEEERNQEDLRLIEEKIGKDPVFRKRLAIKSLPWFARIYFNKYLFYKTAPFQKDVYKALEDDNELFVEMLIFRGGTKTTLAMLFYVIWAMVTGRKHFIVPISDTFGQVKEHIYNIKTELEENKRLIEDFGSFDVRMETQKKEEWQKTSMVIPNYDTKIIGKSTGQKVRGMRYKQYRPDLIIADDIEDLEAVRTKENRDKTHRWLTGNVIPAGEKGKTKFVLTGNLLHTNGIMSRIKKEILEGDRDGKVIEVPLIDKNGKIAWLGKYPDMKAIEAEKRRIGAKSSIGLRAWQREYLLKLVPEEGQVIKDDWIKRYTRIPEKDIIMKGTGNDLAISKKTTADFTAMVSGKLGVSGGKVKIYIMPNPVNERLSGFETTERARTVSRALGGGTLTPFWVEDVAYQAMQIEAMQRAGLPATGIKVSTDKRARLMTVASYVENGTIEFPKEGCEDLILQLIGFGVEAHDDLVDAFVLLIQGMMSNYTGSPKIEWV